MCEGGQASDTKEETESTLATGARGRRDQAADPRPPLPGDWRAIGEVRHTFTHFHLRLDVRLLCLAGTGGTGFLPLDEALAAMPTVFAKAVRLARGAVAPGERARGRA